MSSQSDEIIWKLDEDDNLRAYHKSDLNKPVIWAPQPGSQTAFISCPVAECLYAGTRGPGKTDALLMDFAQDVGRGLGEDWRGILFRRTFPELKDVIAKANKWFPQIFPTAKYNKADHTWTFKDGEQLIFGFMEKEDDYWKYHGHAYPWIGWEELTNWPTDELFKRMFSTNRSSNKNVPRKIRATCNPHGCVPYGEVLTNRGWVPIQEVTTGDQVLSVTETGKSLYKPVTQVHEYNFDGDLIYREGAGLSMIFTPEHRFPHFNTNRSQHTVKSFKELPGEAILRRTGRAEYSVSTKTVVYPETTKEYRKLKGGRVEYLRLDDYAELLGWYVAEGCCCERDRAFCIAQQKQPNVDEISALLDRCNFHYRYDGQAFWISEPYWMEHFSKLGKSREKHIPRWFLDCGTDVQLIALTAMMKGDGTTTNNGNGTYHTISRQLRDDVAEMMTRLGKAVYIHERQRPNRVGLSYEIRMSDRRSISLHTGNHRYDVKTTRAQVNCESTQFTGKVYCLTVPDTETFYIRQNGCVWLSGNSGHNWVKLRYGLPTLPGQIRTQVKKTPGEPDRVAIHGTIHENKILLHANPDYITTLRASCSSPAEEAAWIEGSWDITSGGMFDDIWDREIHILQGITPAMIPRRWRMDRSYDHGQSKPFSVGWWAQSNGEPLTLPSGRVVGQVRGDLIRIQEWYGWDGTPDKGLRMTASEIAIGIRERQREMGIDSRVHPGVADGSIFDQWEPGKSIQGDMRKKGVKWLRADKGPGTRVQGWQQVRELLKNAKPKDNHREQPGLFVSDLCTQFLRTFPVLSRDRKDPEDVDTKIEDHIADEVRYRCRAKQAKRTMLQQG